MASKAVYPKVATDMFIVQMTWTLGFLAVMLLIHLVKIIVSLITGHGLENFFFSPFVASNIYMLVIGIVVGVSLPGYYVRNGVTRKDYFRGTAIASVGVALAIPLIVQVISVLEGFLYKILPLAVKAQIIAGNSLFDPDDANFIGDIIQMIIISPFIDPRSNLISALIVFSLNIYMCYLVGWLIGSGFSRLNIGGLLFIAIGIVFTLSYDILLSLFLGQPLPGTFNSLSALNLSLPVAALGILALILIILWLIRQTTKRLVIKV